MTENGNWSRHNCLDGVERKQLFDNKSYLEIFPDCGNAGENWISYYVLYLLGKIIQVNLYSLANKRLNR